jgi:hypothetical protein
MNAFLSGMNTMGFLIAGLFFLRFWQKNGDALFVAFGVAFFLFALDQFFLSMQETARSVGGWSFLFRLTGFGLLIFAVLRKNLK